MSHYERVCRWLGVNPEVGFAYTIGLLAVLAWAVILAAILDGKHKKGGK